MQLQLIRRKELDSCIEQHCKSQVRVGGESQEAVIDECPSPLGISNRMDSL